MKMPDKDPNLWNFIFNGLTPEAKAMVMATIIAFLRIMYDRKESKWQRIGLESVLCGALSYGISAGLTWFSLPPGVSIFFGAAVGFLGVDFVRSKATKYVDRKIESEKENP